MKNIYWRTHYLLISFSWLCLTCMARFVGRWYLLLTSVLQQLYHLNWVVHWGISALCSILASWEALSICTAQRLESAPRGFTDNFALPNTSLQMNIGSQANELEAMAPLSLLMALRRRRLRSGCSMCCHWSCPCFSARQCCWFPTWYFCEKAFL